jgi:hypothetical protein
MKKKLTTKIVKELLTKKPDPLAKVKQKLKAVGDLEELEPKIPKPLSIRRWKTKTGEYRIGMDSYMGIHDFTAIPNHKRCNRCGYIQKHLIHRMDLLAEEASEEEEHLTTLFSIARWEIYIKQGLDLYARYNDREVLVTVAMKTMNRWFFKAE